MTLIVIPTFQGDKYVSSLAISLKNSPYPVRFVDTSDGGRDIGALLKCYKENPEFDSYFLMHDSMIVKKPNFLDDFNKLDGDIKAWLRFKMTYDSEEQRKYIESKLGTSEAEYGIYGPIMLIPRKIITELIENDMYPPLPTNKTEHTGWERGWGVLFELVGKKVSYIGELKNLECLEKEYEHFAKFVTGRQ